MIVIIILAPIVVFLIVIEDTDEGDTIPPEASFTRYNDRLIVSLSYPENIDSEMTYSIMIINSTDSQNLSIIPGKVNADIDYDIIFVDGNNDGLFATGDYFTNNGSNPVVIQLIRSDLGEKIIVAQGEI